MEKTEAIWTRKVELNLDAERNKSNVCTFKLEKGILLIPAKPACNIALS